MSEETVQMAEAESNALASQQKKRNMLYLVGMALVAAAYILPFYFTVFLRDRGGMKAGSIHCGFGSPYISNVLSDLVDLSINMYLGFLFYRFCIDILMFVATITALVLHFRIKDETRAYKARLVCSVIVCSLIFLWFILIYSKSSYISLHIILKIAGAICLITSLYMGYKCQDFQRSFVPSDTHSVTAEGAAQAADGINSADGASYEAQKEDWKPISMWGYFGYEILYCIPIIGQLLLIVNALAAKNRNVKNFARSYFCLFIVLAVVGAIVFSKLGLFTRHNGYGW